jgi:thymidine phosphorylase
MYQHGMSKKETIFLIKAMLQTGEILNLKHKMIVDKHSIEEYLEIGQLLL